MYITYHENNGMLTAWTALTNEIVELLTQDVSPAVWTNIVHL